MCIDSALNRIIRSLFSFRNTSVMTFRVIRRCFAFYVHTPRVYRWQLHSKCDQRVIVTVGEQGRYTTLKFGQTKMNCIKKMFNRDTEKNSLKMIHDPIMLSSTVRAIAIHTKCKPITLLYSMSALIYAWITYVPRVYTTRRFIYINHYYVYSWIQILIKGLERIQTV